MSFFVDLRRTRCGKKRYRCYWCGESIVLGGPSVRIAGRIDEAFSCARYHPECYGASVEWAKKFGMHDEYPEDSSMIRGTIDPKEE